jgi:hypothetical protein
MPNSPFEGGKGDVRIALCKENIHLPPSKGESPLAWTPAINFAVAGRYGEQGFETLI